MTDTVNRGTCVACGSEVETRSDGKNASTHSHIPEGKEDYIWITCNGTGLYVEEVRAGEIPEVEP